MGEEKEVVGSATHFRTHRLGGIVSFPDLELASSCGYYPIGKCAAQPSGALPIERGSPILLADLHLLGWHGQLACPWSAVASRTRAGKLPVPPSFLPTIALCEILVGFRENSRFFRQPPLHASDRAAFSSRGHLHGGRRVERRHHLARAEPQGAAEAVAELGGRVDAEGVVDRRGEVGRAEGPGDRVGARAGRTCRSPGRRPRPPPAKTAGKTAGQWSRPGTSPGFSSVDPGRPAELAEHDHQRLVEQAAGFEVVEQGRDRPVERREQVVA